MADDGGKVDIKSMVTTISVIGPAQQRVEDVVGQLRSRYPHWRVLAGAGPDANPTAVVAVVDQWDEPAREVITAVAAGQGCVLIFSDAELPSLPGALQINSLEDIPAALGVDERAWNSDAFRADAERADRVKIAIRLGANRIAKELTAEGVYSPEQWEQSYQDFLQQLRQETLCHGVEFPSVDRHVPDYPEVASTIAPLDLAIAGAAAGGAVAAGFAIGRAFGAPLLGLILGGLVAVGLGVGRIIILRRTHADAAAEQRAAALTHQALALTTTVIARINLPRVHTTI